MEDSPGEGHGNPLQYSCLENPHGQRSLEGHREVDIAEQLSTDKIDLKTKIVIRNKGGLYIMIKESIQQDNITFVYMYNICIFVYMYVLKYIKQVLTYLKGEIAVQ